VVTAGRSRLLCRRLEYDGCGQIHLLIYCYLQNDIVVLCFLRRARGIDYKGGDDVSLRCTKIAHSMTCLISFSMREKQKSRSCKVIIILLYSTKSKKKKNMSLKGICPALIKVNFGPND
jgi:hypothetical protein